MVSPLGAITTMLYDGAGRVKAAVDPLLRRTSFAYDALGHQVALRDANGQLTTKIYDAAGRATSTINALGNRITTVYDAAGQGVALVDSNARRTTFQYYADGMERVKIDPLLRRTSYGYDGASQPVWKLDPRGIRTTYAYDLEGRLAASKPSGEAPATFTYDASGNRLLMWDSTGRTTSTFDALSRVGTITDPASRAISYRYDALGNRLGMTDSDGGRTTYAYDAAGRIDHLVNPWSERTSWSYDAAGRVTLERLANGARASSTYDAASQRSSLTHLNAGGTVLFSFAYLYDNVGNRTRVVEANGDRTTWSYDATAQLVAEYRSGATAYRITHVYDAAGNRLVRMDANGRTSYAYDAANQLQTNVDASGTTTYVYDAAGNLQVQKAPASQITTNLWDAENRLVRVTSPSGAITTMTYRADGLRFSKEDASGTAKFLWDGQKLLLESDGNNTTQASYTLIPHQFGQLLIQRRGGISSFYHHSGIGSEAALTDNGANVTDTYVYEGFGAMVAQSGSSVNPFRFIGRLGYYFDGPLGQYYVRARHYSPVLTRWLSEDPAKADPNLYRYVGNNPVLYVDPTGLWKYVPGMGSFSGDFGPGDAATYGPASSDMLMSFDPDRTAFAAARKKGQCYDQIRFVQIYYADYLAKTPLGGTLKRKQWTLDPANAAEPPYYPDGNWTNPSTPVGGSSSLFDSPYFKLRGLLGQAAYEAWYGVSLDLETAAVASKASDKGKVGDVFGSIKWGHSFTLGGGFFSPTVTGYKRYVGNTVWSDYMAVTVINRLNQSGQQETIRLGGMTGAKSFHFFGIGGPPSPEMKKVLTQYFGAEE